MIGKPASDPRPCVLIVDDEEMIRALVRSVLEANDCRVIEADCAREAMELAIRIGDAFDLIVTDIRMPGQTGPELVKSLRARRPGLPVIYISGYSGDSPPDPKPSSTTEFLAKPFALPELVAAVRRLLGSKRFAV